MILTILCVGEAPIEIRRDFPSYTTMFQSLLSQSDADLEFKSISIVDGDELPDPATLEATLITGSPASVYESEQWISELRDFVRWSAAESVPQIGVCFGHQIIAQALGGHVAKSDKGWGVGRHEYNLLNQAHWFSDDRPNKIALAVSHQDQVIAPPVGAVSVMSSDFTPYAGLWYQNAPIISVQGHPEFTKEFATALYTARADRIEGVSKAIESLELPLDNTPIADWMIRFLNSSSKA